MRDVGSQQIPSQTLNMKVVEFLTRAAAKSGVAKRAVAAPTLTWRA